jgi:hypothetical protein
METIGAKPGRFWSERLDFSRVSVKTILPMEVALEGA